MTADMTSSGAREVVGCGGDGAVVSVVGKRLLPCVTGSLPSPQKANLMKCAASSLMSPGPARHLSDVGYFIRYILPQPNPVTPSSQMDPSIYPTR